MSLRKTDIGLAWSAGCSLLTPGLDQNVCFTDEEKTVGSYLTKLEPAPSRPRHTLKSRAPGRKREVHPACRATGPLLSHQQQDTREQGIRGHCCPSATRPGLPRRWARAGVSSRSSLWPSAGSCHSRAAPGRPITMASPTGGRLPPRKAKCLHACTSASSGSD